MEAFQLPFGSVARSQNVVCSSAIPESCGVAFPELVHGRLQHGPRPTHGLVEKHPPRTLPDQRSLGLKW